MSPISSPYALWVVTGTQKAVSGATRSTAVLRQETIHDILFQGKLILERIQPPQQRHTLGPTELATDTLEFSTPSLHDRESAHNDY